MIKMNHEKLNTLFAGWEEAMVWSCLQGCMGEIITDCPENPCSAMLSIGDFDFFAGIPNEALFESVTGFKLLVPRDEPWEKLIEHYFGDRAEKITRYAIKKEPDVFDLALLQSYVDRLAPCYELKPIDQELYEMAKSTPWSYALCSQFKSYAEYENRAFGFAVVHEEILVSGASPYAVYHGGIEIEIATMPEYRNKGLAKACGAALILECQKRGLYPSWDAHDLRSVALSETLGYHQDHPYTAYKVHD